MVSDHINAPTDRHLLPPRQGRGRLQRALDAIPLESQQWHAVGSYASSRCASTMASRIRHHRVDGHRLWDAEWRPGVDGRFVLYARSRQA